MPELENTSGATRMKNVHIGRRWAGNYVESMCPCPKEKCGLVDPDKASPDCTEHPMMAGKTIRQSHSAELCPAS